MNEMLVHCELDPAGVDLAAEAARTIRKPSYYRPAFDEEQVATIESMTAPVRTRLETLSRK
jgi:hypothetical protein